MGQEKRLQSRTGPCSIPPVENRSVHVLRKDIITVKFHCYCRWHGGCSKRKRLWQRGKYRFSDATLFRVFTSALQTEISHQLFDGSLWNLLQWVAVPGRWTGIFMISRSSARMYALLAAAKLMTVPKGPICSLSWSPFIKPFHAKSKCSEGSGYYKC